MNSVGGSISGEASQKAMTADRGAPTASSPAMKGMTSQEQKGASPPKAAATKIIRVSRPLKALPTTVSAPAALSQAISSTAKTM
ncbi:hypothetical protein SAMN02982931_03267 [Bauldia litoralis]|uniref:Uncharacterized protein n=1 Tax=Bauldia litoralis TaxID=665467 RepID=A0A1G6DEC2_9HYPH|nr:hypothetical protein SAMN02982931_03267 [Bauldia litoralis]